MAGAEPILEIRDIHKSFGAVEVLKGISLTVAKGELVTFVGPSGCGKTTLLRIIGGFTKLDSGQVLLEGRSIGHLPPNQRDTKMVFQNYALFPHLTVAENVAFGLKLKKWPKERIKERINYLLSLVHLEGLGVRRIDNLSGGQQQRVAVARALSVEPKILLMDEPLSNLDANLRLIMREEIRRLQERLQITTIFVTHDQYEAMSISDRMVVLQGGGIAQIGSPVEVYQRPATDFIAGFVGYVNFVAAKVKSLDPATQETLVESEFGPLTLALDPGQAQPGQEIILVIRPESINLDRPGPEPGPNAFTGVVESFMYGGALAKCTVSLGSKRVIVDQYDPREDRLFRPGDPVRVMIPRNVHVLGKKV